MLGEEQLHTIKSVKSDVAGLMKLHWLACWARTARQVGTPEGGHPLTMPWGRCTYPFADYVGGASTWGRMPAADNLVEFGVATWNIGGGSETKCQDFLPDLIGSHRQLSNVHFVLLQEATQMAVTATPTTLRGCTLLLHKHEAEWRGQGFMVRDCWGSLTRIQGAPGLLTAVVGKNKDSIASPRFTYRPGPHWMKRKPCWPSWGGHRHYNNLALSWVSTAMRPSISKGQKSDLVPRGERPYLSGRSIMSSDCHYNKALLHPISPTILLNNRADLTTFGFGDFVHLGKGKYCRKPGP